MGLVTVDTTTLSLPLPALQARVYCRALEAGELVYFPSTPLSFADEELEFLRAQKQSGAGYHKNIAYRPKQQRLTGYVGGEAARMQALMQRFSAAALNFLTSFCSPYRFDVDYASFRGLEEAGRPMKPNARNDLLHVDSFPTRPSEGRRILRFFVNVNATEVRVWRTGPPFGELARRYAESSGLLARYRRHRRLSDGLRRQLRLRPPYDRFMGGFHDWLKAQEEFQRLPSHQEWEFPPLSSWMAMTDTVSHAVLRGRFALEQTILVHPDTLQAPEAAPERILAAMA